MFRGMNVDIQLLRVDLQVHVDKWVPAFGQQSSVEGFEGFAQRLTVHQSIYRIRQRQEQKASDSRQVEYSLLMKKRYVARFAE